MMQQYLEIKKNHEDAILFFRLGDFYEMFFDDAILASRELEIALTARSTGSNEKTDMCGVPYHVADVYIAKLVEKGYKVAICEQVEDPKDAKGIVKREVIRVVTPGTILDTNVLEDKSNNYLASIYYDEKSLGFSYVDMSTGEINGTELKGHKDDLLNFIVDELARINPSEILIDPKLQKNKRVMTIVENRLNPFVNLYKIDREAKPNDLIRRHFKKELASLKYKDSLQYSVYVLLDYLYNTQHANLDYLSDFNYYNSNEYMLLDINTISNLEIKETILNREKRGSLLYTLDKTETAMGGRLLKKWVEKPLVDINRIKKRQDIIADLFDDLILSGEVDEILKGIYDLERLIGKISYGNCNARDLISFKNSIADLENLKNMILRSNKLSITDLVRDMDPLVDIYDLIDRSINEEAPITLREGNLIQVGFNQELDKLRKGSIEGQKWIADLELREKEASKIKNLKIGFNKKSGYFFEVTKANVSLVPDYFVRTQTLKNAERYYTSELKDIERTILGSQDRSVDFEYQLFQEVRKNIEKEALRIQKTSHIIASLDALNSLAKVAYNNNYSRPDLNIEGVLDIRQGRHPVVEKNVPNAGFIANDTFLNNQEDLIKIITGPNMSGKSTYMRQVAIIILMAQIGSFVPCDYANISVVDKIFTRIGASDNLYQGESTFMVEMNEVANIVNNASSQSFIILDEVGRGTSTYDGLSIAWALIEYLSSVIKAKTLFATHYHELTDLEKSTSNIKNLTIAVEETEDGINFLRKIIKGSTDQSYGIEVAKIAGLNPSIINRAKNILATIESERDTNLDLKAIDSSDLDFEREELSQRRNEALDSILNKIQEIDIQDTTPLEAINKLYEIKSYVDNIKDDLNE